MARSNMHALASVAAKLSQHSILNSTEIDALLGLPFRVTDIDQDDYLVRDGDVVDSCAALLAGYAYRSKVTGTGSRQICCFHVRGDLVDLQNSVLGKADHSVQALTRASVAYVPHHAILKVCDSFPVIARALWRDTLIDASIFREWILNVGRRDARQRISHLLCEFALRQQAAGICPGPNYEFPLTQEQIGDATGLTSVHVNRIMQSMRRDGIISMGKHRIDVVDWPRLQAIGDFRRSYLHLNSTIAA
jgi:CRP-like cAMP-binding protein